MEIKSGDKDFYEDLCGRQLSEQEIFESKNNLIGFFELLHKIDKRINSKKNEKRKNN